MDRQPQHRPAALPIARRLVVTRAVLLQIISEQEEQGNPIFTTHADGDEWLSRVKR